MNGERLRHAREINRLTQSELAKCIGSRQGTIAMIEKGAREPSEEMLGKIATATGFSVEFFMEDFGFEFPLGSLLYRKYSALSSPDKARCHRIAQECFSLASRMAPRLKAFPVRLPSVSDNDPESAAQLVRSALGSEARSPIPHVIRKLERCGVWIFAIPEEIEKLDAFSTWVGDRPVIVLCDGRPGDRQRWNVSHELGHLMMHQFFRGTSHDLEGEADLFAAELLTPREAILDEITRPVTLSALAELKPRWGVSMRSLMRRARELGVITDRQYKYLNVQAAKNWGNKSEPVSLPTEKPRALRKMAEILYGNPIKLGRLASDSHLPAFWLKRIIESHDDGSNSSMPARSSGQVASFRQNS